MSSILAFPQELRDDFKAWPCVNFTCADNDAKPIFFPIPQGLTFSDSMTYSTIDLGILGDVAAKGMVAAAGEGNLANAIGAGAKTAGNELLAKAKSANVAAAASIAARQLLRQEQVANVIDFANKQVIAPNTNTTFQNSNIRSFQFNFKLVSRTLKDSYAAREIIRTFQEKMYPIGTDVIMAYPPTWSIKFFDGKGIENNKHIPGIYTSYLTGLTTTFNSSTNMFHDDGSPLEVDVAIQFQEIKALTRQEIAALSTK
jgi:hypothetical protein